MGTSIQAEPVFGRGAGAVGNMNSRAGDQIQIPTAAINTEETQCLAAELAAMVAVWDDLMQLQGTPWFPPSSEVVAHFSFTRTKPNKALKITPRSLRNRADLYLKN